MKKRKGTKKRRKIHVVIGTKAQLIKMAPVMLELDKSGIGYNFIFTGQHQETIHKLRENFEVKEPDVVLHKGKDITGIIQMFFWLVKILSKIYFKPGAILGKVKKSDILLVHGDTFSTLLGALMGKFSGIKVAHVESGLRSFNIFHPFPEELVRRIIFWLSDYYFCAGKWALGNLAKFKGKKIDTRLNTLYDSLNLAIKKSQVADLKIPKEKFCLCSIHRFENIFNKKTFTDIINEIGKVSKTIKVLFILHPPTQKQLKKFGMIEKLKLNKKIELRERYDYSGFVGLLGKSEFLITDGGSNQEECFYLGKPCLIMRKTTERREGIGQNAVVCNYSANLIGKFVENYKKYNGKPVRSILSPSGIIVESLR